MAGANHLFGVFEIQSGLHIVDAFAQQRPDLGGRVVRTDRLRAVVRGRADPAIPDQAGATQPRQMRGDPTLRQAGDFGQLGYGELVAFQQQQEP